MSKVILKKSSVAGRIPTIADLDYGELALNYTDGKLYYKTSGNTVAQIGGTSATLSGTALRVVTTVNVTSTQTVFNPTGGYVVDALDVYRNGVKLLPTLDFTATNGSTVTLLVAAENGDVVELIAYTIEALANGYTGAEADARFQLVSQKGLANGYASLDGSGKIPSNQLPSYVDDILEYATLANFPATGVSGVIYVDTTSNKTYRWGGSSYIEVSAGPSNTDALGEGSTNLYYTNVRARAALSFVAGSGAYNSTSGAITIPTNTNQLTNGAGYITGITSSDVNTALGYTPYNNSNPSGFISIDSAIAMAIALG